MYPENKVDCTKVVVTNSTLLGDDLDGVFAAVDIAAGQVVEKGLVRRLPDLFDGLQYPYCFAWQEKDDDDYDASSSSSNHHCTTWAAAAGCATYYNCALQPSDNDNSQQEANTEIKCFYEEDRYEIHALRDITAGEELLFVYSSLDWRPCFQDFKKKKNMDSPQSMKPGCTGMIDPATIQSKTNCHKVSIAKSTLGDFDGAFAATSFRKGDLVEYGIARRLPAGFDGHAYPFCFTWSKERPCPTYAITSGCVVFYNCVRWEDANTEMTYFHEENRFEVHALRDIEEGEELLWTYISLGWRKCFHDVKDILYGEEKVEKP